MGFKALFTNGKNIARRMMLMELASASLIIACAQFLANLPSQDWIPEVIRKQMAFFGGLFISLLKAGEMFFNKSAALYREEKKHETEFKTKTEIKP